MVFLAWEWVRGKPASERVLVVASYCGLFLILALVLFVTSQDIRRLFD
jgi:membrane-associated protease RseP (regulator of RpoE activity)